MFKIKAIINDINYTCIYVLGDWNVDLYFGRGWENLSDFLQRNNFTCIDTNNLLITTYYNVVLLLCIVVLRMFY